MFCTMKTHHEVYYKSSGRMGEIESGSVDLIVTSPPYPMIEMWDEIFSQQQPSVGRALKSRKGNQSFELMHAELDKTWTEAYRVTKSGGFVCINIGDATRSIDDSFALYPNHMRVQKCMLDIGFTSLPCILWRKQTNAPNKFMGSGMLPAGAYVTLEHEYILIFRKGPKREFSGDTDKKRRHESAIFWEERNVWFSDVWFDIKGTRQDLSNREDRSRSGAFPFELAYRLISMYSAKGDVVLDPFMGTGTSMAAAMASGRNSLGYETDRTMERGISHRIDRVVDDANQYILERVRDHLSFVKTRLEAGKPIKYVCTHHRFPVVTQQERGILLNEVASLNAAPEGPVEVAYSEGPASATVWTGSYDSLPEAPSADAAGRTRGNRAQLSLFAPALQKKT